ncbi:MAG TPA: sulfur carrier protein ThiS [Solirubrobacteraceae bacterium]|jgi:sulfur carrier protein|nr:sulfur carrier protein ThiS [Solirubrobacteraceae bacterium]
MTIVLNGEESEARAGETLAVVLERLGVSVDQRGVAVAVDGEVVPRARWRSFALAEEARVEVLTAMQGG